MAKLRKMRLDIGVDFGNFGKFSAGVFASQSVHGFDGLNGARTRTGDSTSLCLRKSRFRRYPLPIRNRSCRDAISITVDFSLRTTKRFLKVFLIESTSFSSPQRPKALGGRKRVFVDDLLCWDFPPAVETVGYRDVAPSGL